MFFDDVSRIVHIVGRITPSGVKLLGTAFLINQTGILVTAAHVIDNNANGLVIVFNKYNSIQDYQDTSVNQVDYIKAEIIEINPVKDVCVMKTEINAYSKFELGSTDDVKVGEKVAILGYPHSDCARMVLTQQDTHVGAKILIDNYGIKLKHIVLNVQARPGQSGSPIIIPEKRRIIGILIGAYVPQTNTTISLGGIDPRTLHQTTHAISSEYIKEMIE